MQLRRLRLRNIRSYESAEVEFGPGTTLIAGDVGTGKTSLLYAIEMALFGFAEVDAAFLVRHEAVHAEVAVTLEHEGHLYEIGRQFRRVTRRGKDTFEVERLIYSEDGVRTAYSATELRQRVIDLFRFPDNPNPRAHSDLWRWAVYVPQERMREVLSQGPEERLETVRKALGVERYRTAAENAQEVASELRQTVRFRREEVARLAHWETELAERASELERREVRLFELRDTENGQRRLHEEAEEELRRAEGTLSATQGDARELEGLEGEEARDAKEASELSARAERLRPELAAPLPPTDRVAERAERQRALEGKRVTLEEARRALEADRTSLDTDLQALAGVRVELGALEQRLAEAQARGLQGGAEIARARSELDRVRSEGPAREPPAPTPRSLADLDRLLGEARERERSAEAERLSAAHDAGEWETLIDGKVCPRCHQAVRPEEFGPHRDEARARSQRAEAEARLAREILGQLDEERRSRERFERVHERWIEIEKRRAIAVEQLAQAERRGQAAAEAIGPLERTSEETHHRRDLLEPALVRQREWQARSESLEGDRTSLERSIAEVRAERERLEAALERHRERTLEHAQLSSEIARSLERRERRAPRLAELRARASQLPAALGGRDGAKRTLASAQARLEATTLDRARTERDVENLRTRREEAQRGVEERTALLQELRVLEHKSDWLAGAFRETLLAMEQRILSTAQAAFQHDFYQYFRTLIDDPTLEAQVDPTFMPTVLIDGSWTPADALSGGERTSLALAFRLAIGRVVRTMGSLRLDTLILDEPTDGFSPEQIVRMGDLLSTLGLPQVLLVSHEFELSAVADRVFETRKTKGRSVILTGRGSVGPPAEGSAEDPPPPPPPPRRAPRSRRTTLAVGPSAGAQPGPEGRLVPRD